MTEMYNVQYNNIQVHIGRVKEKRYKKQVPPDTHVIRYGLIQLDLTRLIWPLKIMQKT